MMLRQLAAGTLLLCLATLSCAQGAATPHKWYVELDAGKSTLDLDQGFTEIDDNSSSWGLRVGYRFTRYFALEAAYIDIGNFSSRLVLPNETVEQQASLDGILLNSRVFWPVATHFQLNASAGLLYSERDGSYDSTSGYSYEASDDNVGFAFALGAAVPVNDRFEIALDYAYYLELVPYFNFSGNPNLNDSGDLHSITLGARFKF